MEIHPNDQILVTGGNGVLGQYIINRLVDEGYQNISIFSRSAKSYQSPNGQTIQTIPGDILELHPLSAAIEKSDVVIHAAAMVSYDPSQEKKMFAINVEGTSNIVNIALAYPVKRLIHISSIAAIGRDHRDQVLDEETIWKNSPLNSYYGITKYQSEMEVWRGIEEGLPASIVSPSVVLGAGDYARSSLQLFDRIYKGLPFHPKGTINLVDALDVALMVNLLLKNAYIGEKFILSAGHLTYDSFFKKMSEAMGTEYTGKEAQNWMMEIYWRFEKVKSILTRKPPLVTRQSLKSANSSIIYDNKKSLSVPGFNYTKIEDSIRRYGQQYLDQANN